MNIVSETERFRALGGTIRERTVNPAGKKQTVSIGWRNTISSTQRPGSRPRRIVIRPMNRIATVIIGFGPMRSEIQPATRPMIRRGIRDSPTSMLASSRSIPLSATR